MKNICFCMFLCFISSIGYSQEKYKHLGGNKFQINFYKNDLKESKDKEKDKEKDKSINLYEPTNLDESMDFDELDFDNEKGKKDEKGEKSVKKKKDKKEKKDKKTKKTKNSDEIVNIERSEDVEDIEDELNKFYEERIRLRLKRVQNYEVVLNSDQIKLKEPYNILINRYDLTPRKSYPFSFTLKEENNDTYCLTITQHIPDRQARDEIYFVKNKKDGYYYAEYMRRKKSNNDDIYSYCPYDNFLIDGYNIDLRIKENPGLQCYDDGFYKYRTSVSGSVPFGESLDLSKLFRVDSNVMNYIYNYECIYDDGKDGKVTKLEGKVFFIPKKKYLGKSFTCRLSSGYEQNYEYTGKILSHREWMEDDENEINNKIYKGF